jgi:hypothetical protein
MGIRERVEDAMILWKSGRREGAFLLALVSVAATARREQPSEGDRVRFEAFLKRQRPGQMSLEYRGECRPVEEILYKWMRCVLVHEGEWPSDIEFMSDPRPGVLSFRAGGAPAYVRKLSEGWFFELLHYVRAAPINSNEFSSSSGEI